MPETETGDARDQKPSGRWSSRRPWRPDGGGGDAGRWRPQLDPGQGSAHACQAWLSGELPSTVRSLGAMRGWESATSRAPTVAVPRVPEPVTGQSKMVSRPELALNLLAVYDDGQSVPAGGERHRVAGLGAGGAEHLVWLRLPVRVPRAVQEAPDRGGTDGADGVGQVVDQHDAVRGQDGQQVPAGGEREGLRAERYLVAVACRRRRRGVQDAQQPGPGRAGHVPQEDLVVVAGGQNPAVRGELLSAQAAAAGG